MSNVIYKNVHILFFYSSDNQNVCLNQDTVTLV